MSTVRKVQNSFQINNVMIDHFPILLFRCLRDCSKRRNHGIQVLNEGNAECFIFYMCSNVSFRFPRISVLKGIFEKKTHGMQMFNEVNAECIIFKM